MPKAKKIVFSARARGSASRFSVVFAPREQRFEDKPISYRLKHARGQWHLAEATTLIRRRAEMEFWSLIGVLPPAPIPNPQIPNPNPQ